MAHRKKSRKKSSKCPEPFNTLIDLAGGIAMRAVSNHMEKKYGYTKKGKINPYAVSAFKLASGRMHSTNDILRTGAFLGALGSFDVDDPAHTVSRSYIPENHLFKEIHEIKSNDNRYAWRLNCEDGSAYGIYPDDYETKLEYTNALQSAKISVGIGIVDENRSTAVPKNVEHPTEQYKYIRVSRLDNGINQYYLSDKKDFNVGDMVTVPTDNGITTGIVLAIETYTAENAPIPQTEMLWII